MWRLLNKIEPRPGALGTQKRGGGRGYGRSSGSFRLRFTLRARHECNSRVTRAGENYG